MTRSSATACSPGSIWRASTRIDCMMVTELVPGGLEGITGQVRYDDYESLH